MLRQNQASISFLLLLIPSWTSSQLEGIQDNVRKDLSSNEDFTSLSSLPLNPVYQVPVASGHVYFAEPFQSKEGFLKRWIISQVGAEKTASPASKYEGLWRIEEMKRNSLSGDLGLVLKRSSKYHAISVPLDQTFEFDSKPLIVQYEVKFQSDHDCGGAYIKLLTKDDKLDLSNFSGATPYTIMFGPDKCGKDEKIHFVFRHKNHVTGEVEEKHARPSSAEFGQIFTDKKIHLLTLGVYPNNSFEIYLDQTRINVGSLLEDMIPPVNPPRQISDPLHKKPEDWDDREKIPDPEAKKPDDWDETQPEFIPDETKSKPSNWLDDEPKLIPSRNAPMPHDWDESIDGEWEPPLIDNPKCLLVDGCGPWVQPMVRNPKFKGKWMPPLISNPNFQGKWLPRMIPNPDYFEHKEPFRMSPISALGLELWSTSINIFFDNFIVTDDKQVVNRWADDGWKPKKAVEVANSKGLRGLMIYFYDRGLERRWLWGVYAFLFLLPFVLLSIIFCPESGPLFKASMIANAMRPGEEEAEAEAKRRERRKERKRRKTTKNYEEQSEDPAKDKADVEQVKEKKRIDESDSSDEQVKEKKRIDEIDSSDEQVKEKKRIDESDSSDEQVKEKKHIDESDSSDEQVEEKKHIDESDSSDEQVEEKKCIDVSDSSDEQVEEKKRIDESDSSDEQVKEKKRIDESNSSDEQVEEKKRIDVSDSSDEQVEEKKHIDESDSSDEQVKEKKSIDESDSSDEQVEKKKRIDESDSSEDEVSHQSRLFVRRRKTKEAF